MNEITTLFTAIGDFFTKSDWYAMVRWPFWTLLFTVAAGGVYCARYGKKTLLNQGISSTLCLIAVYLGSILLCVYCPKLRSSLDLPFLTLTEESASLLDPFTIAAKDLAPTLLKTMILVFLINTADSFCSGGKSIFAWIATEVFSILIALLLYLIIITGIKAIAPWLLNQFAIIPVVVTFALALVVICAKFVFTKIYTKQNKYYNGMNKFFTSNRMGSLLTTSAMCFLFCAVLLFALHASGHYVVSFATANRTGLLIILVMVVLVQFLFEMVFQDRKKV